LPKELKGIVVDLAGYDEEGNPLRMEPESGYFLAEDGHRAGKIIEPYCNADCSLKKFIAE
jgi:hypothetical protein